MRSFRLIDAYQKGLDGVQAANLIISTPLLIAEIF
ncbi:hypothetical protein AZE42_14139 [Rhizopogon vesiculosus]|uniref:Uncharacterized protein n=1 Tax=Rhizopogon vesiculosus TaxID=180088 RepID=A0A1J8R5R2_9AGAM|nr:hypothetical protein AZE42_14139 [Rhizopogon vesiculosus]